MTKLVAPGSYGEIGPLTLAELHGAEGMAPGGTVADGVDLAGLANSFAVAGLFRLEVGAIADHRGVMQPL